MKAAIVTITHVENYGNRLQNYALQVVLEKLGVHSETVFNYVFGYVAIIKQQFKRLIKLILKKYTAKDERKYKFNKFNEKYINKSPFIAEYCKIDHSIDDEYDFFIVGSDQVWNPNYCNSSYYFLDFANKEKRNSYAASFGINTLPAEFESSFSEGLSKFNLISVREEDAVEIVTKLTGKKSFHVLDPTLLLTASEWDLLINKPDNIMCNQFVLVYFLGNIPINIQYYLEDIEKKGKKIIYLESDSKNKNEIKYADTFSYDPGEFLWLIKNCESVFTDSFHGTVFSIIYDKTFWVFERSQDINGNQMGSRLKSLLKQLKLEQFYCPSDSFMTLYSKHDYEEAYGILELEREKSKEFIDAMYRNYK